MVLRAVGDALDEQVAEAALRVALDEIRRRLAAAEPTRLEAALRDLDAKIERTLDLAIEVGDVGTAKERLRTLRTERKRVAGELSRTRLDLPTAVELMPRLRERLRDLEATIQADVPRGRLALRALLGDRRLRVFADNRIEGALALGPVTELPVSRKPQRPADSVVAGGASQRRSRLPVMTYRMRVP